MNHRLITILISLGIIAAIVGGAVSWEWKAIPSKPVAVVETTPHTESSTASTTSSPPSVSTSSTLAIAIPVLGPGSAEAVDEIASATPIIIAVNEATNVTVTIRITDSRVIAGSVNLQRLDASGKVIAVLGTLNDSGTNGDAVAGDKTYSVRKSFTEVTTTPVRLQVSWALSKVLRRAVSNLVEIGVGLALLDPVDGYRIVYPSEFEVFPVQSVVPGFLRGTILAIQGDMPNVTIATYANPSFLPLEEWYNATLADREFSEPDAGTRVLTPISVGVIRSLQVRSLTKGYVQLRTFIPNGDRVIGLESTVPQEVEVLDFYRLILSTFTLVK